MYGGGMQPRQRIRVTSAGGVVYRWDGDNPLFLLLASNKRGVWCLPKGLIEEGEDEVTTAMREVREETGVSRVKLHGKLDRKSTRLNSSHGYISYAVFCLKKKKITASLSWKRASGAFLALHA